MFLKTSLHAHTKEDISDGHAITYDIYELIDRAAELGFDVLAVTGHRKYVYKDDHGKYARKKGILLIPGIELALKFFIRQNHVLVLNCPKEIEEVKSFAELKRFKKDHPEIFIIAPHPASTTGILGSVGKKKLKKFIDVFDAVEHCWLYTIKVNQNREAERIARQHDLPFVATADIHTLAYFNTDYLVVDAEEKTVDSILDAIRQRRYINCTRPKRFFAMSWTIFMFYLIYLLKFPLKIYRLRTLKLMPHD